MGKSKKKRALLRAAETNDAIRLGEQNIPLIVDTTEYVTPEIAERMLNKNKYNRPINWNAVEQIKNQMISGEWKFHGQGIILDDKCNILTGQKRLWAVILSGIPQYFRVSRGSPADTADVIDRGIAQTSRDLAARHTKRKHSPMEEKMAKAILAIRKVEKPSLDEIANIMKSYADEFQVALKASRGIKKTRGVIMVMAALCYTNEDEEIDHGVFAMVPEMATELEKRAYPIQLKDCWRRPAANFKVMQTAVSVCRNGANKS